MQTYMHVLWPQYMYQVPQGSCSTTAGGYTPPPPPLLPHKNFAGGAPVKLTIARAATAGLVDMTRCVATYIPTRRGGSADVVSRFVDSAVINLMGLIPHFVCGRRKTTCSQLLPETMKVFDRNSDEN